MSITPILVDEMEHNTKLLSYFFGIFKSSWYMHLRTLASLLAIVINVLILIKIERVRDDGLIAEAESYSRITTKITLSD